MGSITGMLLKSTLSFLLIGAVFSNRQCDETFPDGVACDENAEDVTQADPENCWKYYKCHGGCVTHETCEEDYKYDDRFQWCTYPHDVDCGDRPCDDPQHCPAPTTIPTTTEDCSPPEQKINCTETGPGYWPDMNNCRKYWHCLKEDSEPEHLTCDLDPETGEFMMWDTVFDGCNFAAYTDCGERPTCDDCNQECWTNAHDGGEIDCGHDLDCGSLKDGWYADPYSCRKYWQCVGGKGYHHMCPEEQMWDPGHDWCNWDYLVECGNRPECNECDEGCP